ncbi:MAG: site-specific integrase [Neisseriaceae bacterium]|nr:MAG: site-specific integrase [Neisseriaceae bacterium]
MFPESELILPLKLAFRDLNHNATTDADACQLITWLKENNNCAKATARVYRTIILRFYLYVKFDQKLTLDQVKRGNIIDYQIFLRNPPKEWQGTFRPLEHQLWRPFSCKKLISKTIAYNVQVIQQLFLYLKNTEYLKSTPAAIPLKVKYDKDSDSILNKYFTEKEYPQISAFIKNQTTKTDKQEELKVRGTWIFSLLIGTGARRSEVANATMNDVVFNEDRIWLKVLGKGNKSGTIPITNQIEMALNEYRAYYNLPPIRQRIESEKNIPLIIKTFKNGKYMTFNSALIGWQLKKIGQDMIKSKLDICHSFRTKLQNISTHWMRHTSATIQANCGIDIRYVQKNLRHASIETTMRYQHVEKNVQHLETCSKFVLDL